MANKFQKSVQERMEAEAERRPPSTLPPDTATPGNIGDFLRASPKRAARNKTFYLDVPVIEAIKATAAAQNVTESMLVNDILSRVLGIR